MKATRSTDQVNASYTPFFHLIKKISTGESDARKIIAEIEATNWFLREFIRVRELAVMHRLGRMRRLRMLEEQKARKRETGFDRIETIDKMSEQHFLASLHSEPLYTKLYNPRWPHFPEEHKLEMEVDVKRLRMEIVLSHPAPPPQCDSSSRRLPAGDTGSDEPGTPRRLPTIGTGSDEPEVSRAESRSTEREGFFSLQASVDGILCVTCSSPEQEWVLLQTDVGANIEKISISEQAAAREEFARSSKKWRQQRMTAWEKDQTKQFDRGG